MDEGQLPGVEALPLQLREALPHPAVHRVPQDGVSFMGQMDPDLVGPARQRPEAQQGQAREPRFHAELRFSALSLRVDPPPGGVSLLPADGEIHRAPRRLRRAGDQCQILPAEILRMEGLAQPLLDIGAFATTSRPEVPRSSRCTG